MSDFDPVRPVCSDNVHAAEFRVIRPASANPVVEIDVDGCKPTIFEHFKGKRDVCGTRGGLLARTKTLAIPKA
jgi:hypothetical protein